MAKPTYIGSQIIGFGSNALTVPDGTTFAVFGLSYWGNGSISSTISTSSGLSGVGSIVTGAPGGGPDYLNGFIRGHGVVSATGSQSLTITVSGSTDEGPTGFIAYYSGVVSVVDSKGVATTSALQSVSINTDTDTELIGWDLGYASGGSDLEMPASGWTSRNVQSNNINKGRLRSKDTVSTPTDSIATVINDIYRVLIAYTLKGTAGGGDVTAPILTSPSGTQTGPTTASGTVTTDEANGTLYRQASTTATPSAATVIAAGLSQAVTATGVQNVTFTGLSPSTVYYAHYVHVDAASNQSTRVSSSSFTTPAADTTAPTLTSPTGTQTGDTTATGTVSTNEANGTLYRLASTAATPSAATVIAAGLTQTVTTTGTQNVTFTGLTASTTYYAHYVHVDAAGNQSSRVSSSTFTTSASLQTPEFIGGSDHYIYMGTSATPGAQSLVDVPTTAKLFVAHLDIGGYPSPINFTSISSNFTGAFTTLVIPQTATASGAVIAIAEVTSTGSGKTVTPIYANTNSFAGAGLHYYFLDKVDLSNPVIDWDGAQTADGTTANTVTIDSLPGSLVVVRDTHASTTTDNYPALGTGFTNLSTGQTPIGANTYNLSSRLKQVTTPTSSTVATTQASVVISNIVAVAFRGAPVVADSEAPVLTGSITTGTRTNSSIAITYPTATDNVAVTGYELSRDAGSTYPYTSVTTGYTFTGLANNTSYDIRVRARDAAGNRSSAISAAISSFRPGATGQYIIDNTGPIGDNPGGILYNDVVLPGDATKWFSFEIVTPPASGTLDIQADGRFTFTGPSYTTFTYQLYVDNVATGSPATVTLYTIGKRRIIFIQ